MLMMASFFLGNRSLRCLEEYAKGSLHTCSWRRPPIYYLPPLWTSVCLWPHGYRIYHVCVMTEICAHLPNSCTKELSPWVQSLQMVLVEGLGGSHSRALSLQKGAFGHRP